MRIIIQRVSEASVTIAGEKISEIKQGLLLFVGIENGDTEEDLLYLTHKTVNLRIFDDEKGIMNRSILDIGGEALVASQFTLHAATKKGNRPSYIHAAKPEISQPMYNRFCETLERLLHREVKTGRFGADMKVALVNDGPVTIWIDSKNKE